MKNAKIKKVGIKNKRNRSLHNEVPDPSTWLPRDASSTLAPAFSKECASAEKRLLDNLQHEKSLSIDHFDSGLPFEALVRSEFGKLLPKRYKVGDGLVLDRNGRTAGKCDFVVFNEAWFSPVKSPLVEDSGKPYLPIEGVYAIGELKQSLSRKTLHEAMEKLVTCHRLSRPRTYAHRVVENREGSDCPHGLTNPLFSFILAGGVSQGEDFDLLVRNYFEISTRLKRLEVIHVLCVLGYGALSWGFRDPFRQDEIRPALFMKDDLFHPIFPTFFPASMRSPLLCLVQAMQLSLYHTILGPEDVATAYGFDNRLKVPSDLATALPPDKEWLELLAQPCKAHDEPRD
jgi:hypothetical protein